MLPLADSAGGHRLGVNGLAVDTDNSILYVSSNAVTGLPPLTGAPQAIPLAETELSALGI